MESALIHTHSLGRAARFHATLRHWCQALHVRPFRSCTQERVTRTVLVPTMINVLTQFDQLARYDLSSLVELGYGGSPIAPELIHRARQALPHVKLVQVYGLSETGFLTGLQDHEHTESRLLSCGRPCPGVDVRVS